MRAIKSTPRFPLNDADMSTSEAQVALTDSLLSSGWRFRRPVGPPRDSPATLHVYLSNVAGASDGALEALGRRFGALQRVTRCSASRGGEGGTYAAAVLSFASAAAAAAAVAQLDGAPPLDSAPPGTRPLSARFAQLEPPQAPPEAEPEPLGAQRDAAALGIDGLWLVPDFVDEAEEAALLAHVDADASRWQRLARRRVLHEGFRFDYATRAADAEAPPFGAPVSRFLERLNALPQAAEAAPYDQLTVNEYLPGAGIPPHVDTHSAFRGALASLSLGGPCAMLFRRGADVRALLLPPRSLLLLAGEARFAWQHYIPSRMADPVAGCAEPLPRAPRRVSFTFRRTVPPALRRCTCGWPEECDTAAAEREAASPELAESAPAAAEDGRRVPAVEQAHVRELYERIAPHFSATRFAVWPAVRRFLTSLPPAALVIDAGCGNGKYLAPAAAGGARLAMIGTDAARGLLRLAARAGGDGALAQADAAALPLRSGCADAVICVAVLHHLSSEARRLAALAELARCLQPGGRALVTVWALEQAEPERTLRKWEPISTAGTGDASDGGSGGGHLPNREYFVPWHLPLHRPEFGAAARAAAADAAASRPEAAAPPRLDEAKGAVVFRRYYHLFAAGELAALAGRVPGLRLEAEFFDASNWVVELTKM